MIEIEERVKLGGGCYMMPGFAAAHVPFPVAIPLLDRRLQPQLDQPQHVPVGDAAGH